MLTGACTGGPADKGGTTGAGPGLANEPSLREQFTQSLRKDLAMALNRSEMPAVQERVEQAGREAGVLRVRIIRPDGTILFGSDPTEIYARVGDDTFREVVASNEPASGEGFFAGQASARHLVPLRNGARCVGCHGKRPPEAVLGVLEVRFHLEPDAAEAVPDLEGRWYSMPPDRMWRRHRVDIYGPRTFDVIEISQSGSLFRGRLLRESGSFATPQHFQGKTSGRDIERLECYGSLGTDEPLECEGRIEKRGKRIRIVQRRGELVLFREDRRPWWLPYAFPEPDRDEKVGLVKADLRAIRSVEIAYLAEWGAYVGNQPFTPVADRRGNPEAVPWNPKTRFAIMGFDRSEAFCSYRLEGDDFPSREQGFAAVAQCDLDGDGRTSLWRITDESDKIAHSGDDY